MGKALDILKYIRNNDYIMDFLDKADIKEAISELEKAMKPKTCSNCKYSFYWECADVLECTKLDKQRCYKCDEDVSMTEVVGDFYCNRYEAKAEQC